VRSYTLKQLRTFSAAASRARSRDLVDAAWNMRAAQMAEAESFKKYIKVLSDG
jgi:hypothetical protein